MNERANIAAQPIAVAPAIATSLTGVNIIIDDLLTRLDDFGVDTNGLSRIRAHASGVRQGKNGETFLPELVHKLQEGNAIAKEYAAKLEAAGRAEGTIPTGESQPSVATDVPAIGAEVTADSVSEPASPAAEKASPKPVKASGPRSGKRRPVTPAISAEPDTSQVAPPPVPPAMAVSPETSAVKDEDIGPIAMAALQISRWNRSYKDGYDPAHVARLRADIERNDLIQGVGFVRAGKTGSGFRVLVGAHRFLALREERGPDGVLQPHEYRILPDLTEDDPRCLDVSLKENSMRQTSSVLQAAQYVTRLIDEECQPREHIAELMGIPVATVSRLKLLPPVIDKLPKGWQQDLRTAPECDTNHTIAITPSHWAVVAATIEKQGLTPEITNLMEQAHSHRWSVHHFDDALGNIKARKKKVQARAVPAEHAVPTAAAAVATTSGADTVTEPVPASEPVPATPSEPDATATVNRNDPAAVGKHAMKLIREAADALLETTKYPDIPGKLNKITAEIEQRIRKLQSPQQVVTVTAQIENGVESN